MILHVAGLTSYTSLPFLPAKELYCGISIKRKKKLLQFFAFDCLQSSHFLSIVATLFMDVLNNSNGKLKPQTDSSVLSSIL